MGFPTLCNASVAPSCVSQPITNKEPGLTRAKLVPFVMDVEGLTNAQATLSFSDSEVTRWKNHSSCCWTTALPPEILAQIFSLVLRAPAESAVDIEGDTQVLPGTRIKWAATTRARVPLRLYLTIDGSETTSNSAGELVSMFSQRSKTAPLSIGVNFLHNKRSGSSTSSTSTSTMGSAVIMGQFLEIAQRGVVEKQDDLSPEPKFDIHLVSGVSRPNVVPLTEERYVWRYKSSLASKTTSMSGRLSQSYA